MNYLQPYSCILDRAAGWRKYDFRKTNAYALPSAELVVLFRSDAIHTNYGIDTQELSP